MCTCLTSAPLLTWGICTAGFCAVSDVLPLPQNTVTEISTQAVYGNGMNAAFGKPIHCLATEPHATLLRLSVRDEGGARGYEVANETAVLGRLRRGYRVLQLRGSLGTRIELAHVLVKISFATEAHLRITPRQQQRQLREQREATIALQKRVEGLEATLTDPGQELLSVNVQIFDGFHEKHSTTYNWHLVLLGDRKALIDFLKCRPDVMSAMGIVEVLEDGFVSMEMLHGTGDKTNTITLAEQGKSVIYIKSAIEQVVAVKPLYLFDTEFEFGRPIILVSELIRKLSEEDSLGTWGQVVRQHGSEMRPSATRRPLSAPMLPG